MHKISIIIPSYNNEKYLKRCIDSALNQTYPDIEVVCIDDKSTDNSLQLLKKYTEKDNRIKLLALSSNMGVSNARNIALQMITGECVCFLDSDDYLEKTACADLYDSLVRQNSDLACGGHIKVNSSNHKVSAWLPEKDISGAPKADIFKFTKHRNVTQKLFKTQIIKEHDLTFNKDLNYMEDAVFLMNYLQYCSLISGVKKVLYNVQINMNSLCRSKKLKNRRENDKLKASSIIGNL